MNRSAALTENRTLEDASYRLVPLHEGDATDRYVGMLNDPVINRFLTVRFTPQTKESVKAYIRAHQNPPVSYLWGIYARSNGEFIGTATLDLGYPQHLSGELGLMVGSQEYWGKGVSTAALKLMMRFAFEDLKLRRLSGGNYSVNHGMNFTYKRLGFRLEGKFLKSVFLTPGEYTDVHRWALLEEEYRSNDQRSR